MRSFSVLDRVWLHRTRAASFRSLRALAVTSEDNRRMSRNHCSSHNYMVCARCEVYIVRAPHGTTTYLRHLRKLTKDNFGVLEQSGVLLLQRLFDMVHGVAVVGGVRAGLAGIGRGGGVVDKQVGRHRGHAQEQRLHLCWSIDTYVATGVHSDPAIIANEPDPARRGPGVLLAHTTAESQPTICVVVTSALQRATAC